MKPGLKKTFQKKSIPFFRNDNPLNSRGSGTCIYVKNIFTCKKYENIEITGGEPSKGIDDVWSSIQAIKFISIIVGAVYKNPITNPDCIAYLEKCYKPTVIGEKTCTYMLGDLNEDLLKANRLEQTLNKLNLLNMMYETASVDTQE